MAIHLAPDIEASIRQRLEDGNFKNENDVVREALRLLGAQAAQRSMERPRTLKPSEALELHREEALHVFEGKRVSNPRVFGSVARGEDHAGSDLDILVDPVSKTSLFDLAGLERELEELLGFPVDVITPGFLPETDRERAIAEAKPL